MLNMTRFGIVVPCISLMNMAVALELTYLDNIALNGLAQRVFSDGASSFPNKGPWVLHTGTFFPTESPEAADDDEVPVRLERKYYPCAVAGICSA